MTTNFYLKKEFEALYPFVRTDEVLLIGKRAAAGRYCWSCRRILIRCWGQNVHGLVHSSLDVVVDSMGNQHKVEHLEECPSCGKKAIDEGFNGAVGRELGFNKLLPSEKHGVSSTSSFMFALRFQELFSLFTKLKLLFSNKKVIQDEYDRDYSLDEFFRVLSECGIQYIDESTNWS